MNNTEKLYTPSQWCSHRCDPSLVVKKHIEVVEKESASVKTEISSFSNERYGNGPKQFIDIFEPPNVNKKIPTFIYIHGGYWQELNKDISSYCVKPLIQAGIRVIIPGYDLVPNIKLEAIINEIKDLAKYVRNLAKKHSWGDTWFGGHSAGAHLAACLMYSNFSSELNIAGFVLISGIYDLKPLIRTTINEKLQITNENFAAMSPLYDIRNVKSQNFQTKVLLIVGEFDSPAFHNQTDAFKAELEKLQIPVTKYVINEMDHFTVVENLCNENYDLANIIIMNIVKKHD